MAYKFLNKKISDLLSSATGAGGFMFARALNFETFKTEFSGELSEKTQEILSHDFETFSKIISFLNGNLNTFVLNGFMGSGKSAMINLVPFMIDSSVLYFRVNCFDSTNLDDVLLSLHTDFVNYHNTKKIVLPKVDSNGFTERINTYIRSGNVPMLFVFDSLDSERCPFHSEIINFVKHISQIDKIKVIVTSRNTSSSDFDNEDSSNLAIIKLCGKEEFIELLNKYGIESDEETYESTFIASKGHYLYISLIINVIKLLNISLKSLYNDYSKKKMTIFDFLVSKVLTLIPEKFFKVLWFLSLIRTGVKEDFLITQKLSTPDQLAYLEERMLLCREGVNIYLKDYVKHTVENTINAQTRKDIHTYLSELYDSQLPKKPSERDLIISRSTMRREAAYHKEIADNTIVEEQIPKQNNKTNIDYNYLSYSKSIKKDWNFSNSSIAPKQQQRFVKPAPRGMETRINNNLRARQYELTNEELNMLNQLNMNIPNGEFVRPDKKLQIRNNENQKYQSAQQYIEQDVTQNRIVQQNYINQNLRNFEENQPQYQPQEQMQMKPQKRVETLADVMREASLAEQEFNYEKALAIYGKAYSMTESAGYDQAKPIIMMQTAYCHKKMQNNDEALKCFEAAYNLYSSLNPVKANDAMYNMAEIYTEIYSYSQAKSMYEKILDSGSIDELFKVRVLLNLAEIENNNSDFEKSEKHYNEALNIATHAEDKKLICESCFKYGLACDDAGEVEKAFKLYLRCVQTSNDTELNTFISSAYSNIAEIYEDQNHPEKAVKYYEEAAKADERMKNWDGMYFECTKIASFYQSQSLPNAIKYAEMALLAAKQLNDEMYITSTCILIGDYHYRLNQHQEALKAYLNAKLYISQNSDSENIRKIDVRINNVQKMLPIEIFNKIKSEIGVS